MVSQEIPVLMGPLVNPERPVRLYPETPSRLAVNVLPELPASLEHQALLVNPEEPALAVPLESQESQETLDLRDHLVEQVCLDSLESPEQLGRPETLDLVGVRGRQDQADPPDLQDFPDLQDQEGLPENQDPQEPKDLKDLLGHLDLLGQQASLDPQDPWLSQERMPTIVLVQDELNRLFWSNKCSNYLSTCVF